MAGLDVDGGGGGGGRRSNNSEINMIPMIDLLMVTISFLLITAVWVQSSRLEAGANVPGKNDDTPKCEGAPCKDTKLHVITRDPAKFTLEWKEGATVIRSIDVPREQAAPAKGAMAFPALATRIGEEWRESGVHRDARDFEFDKAVVHADNAVPYKDLIAVMDAVAKPTRPIATANGKLAAAQAFEITFATD